jgi:glycine reductase complex component B subunit alpha and beta
MSGPGADASIYGKTYNIVVLGYPAAGITMDDYRIALKIAGLKTAAYLARAGKGETSDETELFDLPPLQQTAPGMLDLPRVVYIFQVMSLQYNPIAADPVLYGANIDRAVPTILHPNEIFDGALVRPWRSILLDTYILQNHPIIKELYRRHGKDLYFAGVIITTAPNNVPEYERVANIAANLAKWVLNADGAILTKSGGGAPELAMARTAQRCEELGIRTGIAMIHMGIDFTDARFGGTVIFNMPELDAIVSMGHGLATMALPAMDRIVGSPAAIAEEKQIGAGSPRRMMGIKGVLSQLGESKLTTVRY